MRVLRSALLARIQSASLPYNRNQPWDLLDYMPEFDLRGRAAFDQVPWDWMRAAGYYFYGTRQLRLYYIEAALHCYYLDHDNTLPESLDELVGTYLNEIPIDPKDGKPMKYQPERDEELIETFKNSRQAKQWLYKPGWPHIVFERKIRHDGQLNESDFSIIRDLTFLPGYAEYGKEAGSP